MKETKIRGLIPRYEAGDIFHITGFCDDVEQELMRFPNSEHDDCADSLAYQLQIAEKPFKVIDKVEIVKPQFRDIGV
jgi:phage terminase large subunit-like protein